MRVVCLAPGVEDLLGQLGLGARIVGRDGDPAALAAARPDVVITPEPLDQSFPGYRMLEHGVAVAESSVGGVTVRLLSAAPARLEHVVEQLRLVPAELGEGARGAALHRTRSARLLALRLHVARYLVRVGGHRPPTVFLDVDRGLRAPGRWLPDMVDAAGGVPLLVAGGEADRDVTVADVGAAQPELVLLGLRPPPGRSLAESAAAALPEWGALIEAAAHAAWAVDLRRCFDRPGPALVEGVETLLRIIMPAALGANGTPPGETDAIPLR